jgi:multidrug efflux system outer membrane protein
MLTLAGCAVGPDYVRPELATDVPETYAASAATDSIPELDRWWTAFGDSTLNRLVDQALRDNQDLKLASARVLEARAALGGAQSDRWPSIEVGGTASRSKSSLATFGGQGSAYRNYFDANLTASYELDLWGRLSRAEESARATLLQSEMNRRTVTQTLVADVVRTWLQVRELQCQLGLTLRTIDSFRSTLTTVEDRYARGVVPALDVRLARQNLLVALAAEPEFRRQLGEGMRRLEILLGRYPAGVAATLADEVLAQAVMPDPLPVVPAGLPSSLLERRPDLMAAEAGLHASVANVGSAKARLYPTIALTASAGYTSGELDTWFDSMSDVWSLGANLFMPLINRGATTAQIKAAEARADQAVAQYQSAILAAFGEVENALDSERYQGERERLLEATVREAERSLQLARQRYSAGLDNLLSTLETQRRYFNAESDLLSTQRAYRTARVNLILALGGPWDAELTEPLLAAERSGNQEGDQE